MKKILVLSIISLLFVQMFYLAFEPAVTLAATAPDAVVVTLTVDSGITITAPLDVTMSPNMGIGADGSLGSATWTVKTNKTTGYSLGVKKASAAPALVSSGNSFDDYTEVTAGTPETWSLGATSKEFGFSAFGTDTTSLTPSFGTGSDCGSGAVPSTTLKYLGFKVADKIVATRSTVTPTTGIATTVCLAAQQNGVYAPSGTYTATITATATEI